MRFRTRIICLQTLMSWKSSSGSIISVSCSLKTFWWHCGVRCFLLSFRHSITWTQTNTQISRSLEFKSGSLRCDDDLPERFQTPRSDSAAWCPADSSRTDPAPDECLPTVRHTITNIKAPLDIKTLQNIRHVQICTDHLQFFHSELLATFHGNSLVFDLL